MTSSARKVLGVQSEGILAFNEVIFDEHNLFQRSFLFCSNTPKSRLNPNFIYTGFIHHFDTGVIVVGDFNARHTKLLVIIVNKILAFFVTGLN